MLVHKGTSMGWDYERWSTEKNVLSSLLISIINTWKINIDERKQQNEEFEDGYLREIGKINHAFSGLQNDIHNLSIIIDMINTT